VDGLVGAMGGHGPAFVVAYVHRGLHTQAWTIVGQPSDAIAAMIRELRRGAGEIVWEP
jgi:hypothetical protein